MPLTARDRALILTAIMLALFLGALDQTIVSTALPAIVADLEGLDRYAWVATAYLLASTSLVPIYGKLADMRSRRSIELVAMGLFLTGSAFSYRTRSSDQLSTVSPRLGLHDPM
ncbi:MAG: hypothetical protein WEA24_09520 [Gemmatimonadota bacterium]